MSYTLRKKKATETACESNQMLDLTENDFKAAIVNMFKEIKETMVKEVEKM